MRTIRPWLYVGSYQNTLDAAALAQAGIAAMLQLHVPVKHPGITTLFLPLEDGRPIPPVLLERGVKFVREHRALGHKTLIACGAGVSRSATLAAAVLVEEEHLSLTAAFFQVRAVNPRAMPDQVHWESLRQYYGDGLPFWELWKQIEGV